MAFTGKARIYFSSPIALGKILEHYSFSLGSSRIDPAIIKGSKIFPSQEDIRLEGEPTVVADPCIFCPFNSY